MGTFRNAINEVFFLNNSSAAASASRVPLLDSSGYPTGSDTLENLLAQNAITNDINGLKSKTTGVLHLGTFSTTDNGFRVAANHAFDQGVGVLTFKVDWPARDNAFTVTILQQQQYDGSNPPQTIQTLIGNGKQALTYQRVIRGTIASGGVIGVGSLNVAWTRVNWFTSMQWDATRGLVCNSLTGNEGSQVVLMSDVATKLQELEDEIAMIKGVIGSNS